MRLPLILPKQMLWIFLLAVVATALLNGMKLGSLLWQTWQIESAGGEPGVQDVNTPGIALASFGK